MKIYDSQKKVDLSDILKIEKELGFYYPDSYRQFLLDNNGGYPSKKEFFVNKKRYRLYYFIPIRYSDYNQELCNKRLSISLNTVDFFPFAIDDLGNYYSFNAKKEIIYWEILTKNFTKIASKFDDFLQLFDNNDTARSTDNNDFFAYKTYQGKNYTEEEWKIFEEQEYQKYLVKRNGRKSSFLADEGTEKKNFSAETGRLKEVEYFVMNSKQDQVPIYEFPSAMVAPFTFLENGTAVEMVKFDKNGWCEIRSKEGKKGFIQANYVKKND